MSRQQAKQPGDRPSLVICHSRTWLPMRTMFPSMSRTKPDFCPHGFCSGALTGTAPFSTGLGFTVEGGSGFEEG